MHGEKAKRDERRDDPACCHGAERYHSRRMPERNPEHHCRDDPAPRACKRQRDRNKEEERKRRPPERMEVIAVDSARASEKPREKSVRPIPAVHGSIYEITEKNQKRHDRQEVPCDRERIGLERRELPQEHSRGYRSSRLRNRERPEEHHDKFRRNTQNHTDQRAARRCRAASSGGTATTSIPVPSSTPAQIDVLGRISRCQW